MNAMRMRVAVAVVAAAVITSAALADSVTVGNVTASGTTAVVPVYVRDLSGTPLGVDSGAGKRIQGLSFKVLISPAAAVSAATFSRSGVTQSLSPLFESAPSSSGTVSYLASFEETTNPIPLTLNAASPGNEVAKITLTLSNSAQPGSTITLSLDPAATSLSNQSGTVSEAPPGLTLVDGSVSVPPLGITLSPADQEIPVDASALLSVVLSRAAPVAGSIGLSAAPAGVVSVPDTVSITAGNASVSFLATALGEGTATVTATLPGSLGGGSATASVLVFRYSEPTPPANLSPADGAAGVVAPVVLRWSAVPRVTHYDVHFGTSPQPATTITTTLTERVVTTLPGTKYYWSVKAVNPAGSAMGPEWSFTTGASAPNCQTPAVPVLSAPEDVLSGQAYVVRWESVPNATEYRLEESSTANFASATTTVIAAPATQAAFSRSTDQDVTYFYRVLAHNGGPGCNVSSARSAASAVLVKATQLSRTRVLVVAGSTAGAFGSFFRTAVQIHNAGSTPIAGRFIFHAQGTSGSDGDPKVSYTLGARETRSYADILQVIGVEGLGSLDLVTDFGALPRAVIRVYNDAGEHGTAGLTVPLIRPEDALTPGRNGLLVAPLDATRARFNLGFRTLNEETAIILRLMNAAGSLLRSVPMTFPTNYFVQHRADDVLGVALGDSDVVEVIVERGALIVYGSTTDNITQDASIQIEVVTP